MFSRILYSLRTAVLGPVGREEVADFIMMFCLSNLFLGVVFVVCTTKLFDNNSVLVKQLISYFEDYFDWSIFDFCSDEICLQRTLLIVL